MEEGERGRKGWGERGMESGAVCLNENGNISYLADASGNRSLWTEVVASI